MRIIDCEQGSDEWYQARLGIPTASEFSRIVTPAKWAYASGASTYIAELIAESYVSLGGQLDDFSTAAMRKGTALEPEARRYFEFSMNVVVQRVGFCLTDCGRFGCSPDALVGEDDGLEIKSPEPKTHVKWLLAGGVPDEHLGQVHGCMFVTGRSRWHFLSYCPPLPELLVLVERDEKTEQLGAHLEKFWGEYQSAKRKIEGQDKPAPTKVMSFGGESIEINHFAQNPF